MSVNNLDVKIRILQVDGDKPISFLDLRHDGSHRQHLGRDFQEGAKEGERCEAKVSSITGMVV